MMIIFNASILGQYNIYFGYILKLKNILKKPCKNIKRKMDSFVQDIVPSFTLLRQSSSTIDIYLVVTYFSWNKIKQFSPSSNLSYMFYFYFLGLSLKILIKWKATFDVNNLT